MATFLSVDFIYSKPNIPFFPKSSLTTEEQKKKDKKEKEKEKKKAKKEKEKEKKKDVAGDKKKDAGAAKKGY